MPLDVLDIVMCVNATWRLFAVSCCVRLSCSYLFKNVLQHTQPASLYTYGCAHIPTLSYSMSNEVCCKACREMSAISNKPVFGSNIASWINGACCHYRYYTSNSVLRAGLSDVSAGGGLSICLVSSVRKQVSKVVGWTSSDRRLSSEGDTQRGS